ncbi:MAG: biotin/lipoyl-binding protein, partial [Chitinophagaceae bacterium]
PLACDGSKRTLRVQGQRNGRFLVGLTPTDTQHDLRLISHDTNARGGVLRYELDGVQRRLLAVWCETPQGCELHVVQQAATFVFNEVSAWPDAGNAADPSRALSPVAGTVAQVLVKAGDTVVADQPLLSIEAMKMEMWLSAQAPGVIKAVYVQAGEQVQAKTLLIDIELTTKES